MKLIRFSELFKQAAEKAKNDAAGKPEMSPKTLAPKLVRAIPFYNPQSRTKLGQVAGGEIIWKPIDRVARRVIQPAPWWAKILYGTFDLRKNDKSLVHAESKDQPHNPQRLAFPAHRKNGAAKKSSKKKAKGESPKVRPETPTPDHEREKVDNLKRLIAGEITAKQYHQLSDL